MDEKLVRDAISARIRKDGKIPVTHEADDDEYIERLCDKLVEEAEEYRESKTTEELADVMQVILSIRRHQNISRQEVKRKQRRKKSSHGRFRDRTVLEEVHESCTYCSTVSEAVEQRTIGNTESTKPLCDGCFQKYSAELMQSRMHL